MHARVAPLTCDLLSFWHTTTLSGYKHVNAFRCKLRPAEQHDGWETLPHLAVHAQTPIAGPEGWPAVARGLAARRRSTRAVRPTLCTG
jgi:hypothetical protein